MSFTDPNISSHSNLITSTNPEIILENSVYGNLSRLENCNFDINLSNSV